MAGGKSAANEVGIEFVLFFEVGKPGKFFSIFLGNLKAGGGFI